MSLARRLPQSNISRKYALCSAVDKNDTVDISESALTSATIIRLTKGKDAFTLALSAVHTAEAFHARKGEPLKENRRLLRKNIAAYFKGINNAISTNTIPEPARAFYGLDISNKRLPKTNTDSLLIYWADQIIKGDANRVSKGGIAMANPSIIEFTAIYNITYPLISEYSNATSDLIDAQTKVKNLLPEIDKLIRHTWNEIETFYSDLKASTKRSTSRNWGVLYISVGKPAIISGRCFNSETGEGLAKIKIHLSGVNKSVLTDSNGNYVLHTRLYGDMELIATQKEFVENCNSFMMDNGINTVINIAMIPL